MVSRQVISGVVSTRGSCKCAGVCGRGSAPSERVGAAWRRGANAKRRGRTRRTRGSTVARGRRGPPRRCPTRRCSARTGATGAGPAASTTPESAAGAGADTASVSSRAAAGAGAAPVQSNRQYDSRRNEAVRRQYQRPHYYSNRGYGYGSRTIIVPRFITPRYVTVVPYRPYVYRPSFGLGVYYGTGGSYPYGYTPRGYYDPIPGSGLWRSAHHRRLSHRGGVRRRLLRWDRERLRRRVPAPESRGWSAPDRDQGTRARVLRVRRDGAARPDDYLPR